MDQNVAANLEVEEILRHETFLRAPSQSKILRYLCNRLPGATGAVTQFDIATEALGKSDDFDEATDSSVRVQVGRLRRSLADYYRTNAPINEMCVYVRSGEYRLRLGPISIAYPDLYTPTAASKPVPEVSPSVMPLEKQVRPDWATGRVKQYAVGLAIVLIAIFGVQLSSSTREVEAHSSAIVAPPYITAELKIAGGQAFARQLSNMQTVVESDIDALLQKSMVSRTVVKTDANSGDYRLLVSFSPSSTGEIKTFVSLRNKYGKLVTEQEYTFADIESAREMVNDTVTAIISPAGAVSKDLGEKIGEIPASGFECFIAIETYRSVGDTLKKSTMLDVCLDRFPQSDYYPYFAARDVFRRVQAKQTSGKATGRNSEEWMHLSKILQNDPKNAYANTVAAKLLVGEDSCTEAGEFASEAFSRGRTYPALELAVIVDAFDCRSVSQHQSFWAGRIERIMMANTTPHPLLETYILLGLIVSDQTELVVGQKTNAFDNSAGSQLLAFNAALKRQIDGRGLPEDLQLIRATLPSLIWNPDTLRSIESKIALRAP